MGVVVPKAIPVEKNYWNRIQEVKDGTTTELVLIDPVKEEVELSVSGKLLIIFSSGE